MWVKTRVTDPGAGGSVRMRPSRAEPRPDWFSVCPGGNQFGGFASGFLERLFAPVCRFRRKLGDFSAHFLAGFEFHDAVGGNGHINFRAVGVAAHTALAELHLKHAEVAEFHAVA